MLRGAHTRVSQGALADTGTAHLGCAQVRHFPECSVLLCPALCPFSPASACVDMCVCPSVRLPVPLCQAFAQFLEHIFTLSFSFASLVAERS